MNPFLLAIVRYLRLVAFLLLLFPAAAQLPAGLHQVARLVPAEGPRGGLVPYRQGSRWGYADRSGRLRVAPWLPKDPGFLVGGLHQLPSPVATDSFMVINGLGHCLRVGRGQALLADPTGTLTSVGTWLPDAPLVYKLPERYWRSEDDLDRWCLTSSPSNRYIRQGYEYSRFERGHGRFEASRRLPDDSTSSGNGYYRYALTDYRGRHLTGQTYGELGSFNNRRALVVRNGRLGYLDPQGREVISPLYYPYYQVFNEAYSNFHHGLARVWDDSLRYGLIDTTGRVVLPLRHWPVLYDADEAGYCLLRRPTPAGDTVYQYLGPGGRPAFGGRTFTRAEPFWHGRAWVWRGQQVGLLNARGRLVVPYRYDDLYFSHVRYGIEQTQTPARQHAPNRCFFEAPNAHPIHHLDTLCLQAVRDGKVGFVDFKTGRELVRPRYDYVFFSFRAGLACVGRGQQMFIINYRGRELCEGRPYDAFNNGGEGRDWQWGQGRHTYLLLSKNHVPNTLVADTAWLVLDRRGREVLAPQPMSRLPLFVTGAGCVAIRTDTGYGLLAPGGGVVLAPRYQQLAQYGRLVVAFAPEDSVTSRISLFDERGQLLRVLPGVRHLGLFDASKLLYLTQRQPDHTWRTLLLTQAGHIRIILAGCHNVNELVSTVALRQRRQLLRVSPEMDPITNNDLPGSPPGGYLSTRGRRFWHE
jgi:hypothetical protein